VLLENKQMLAWLYIVEAEHLAGFVEALYEEVELALREFELELVIVFIFEKEGYVIRGVYDSVDL
jgi:hypothetical protein